jgi:hypothetical protein
LDWHAGRCWGSWGWSLFLLHFLRWQGGQNVRAAFGFELFGFQNAKQQAEAEKEDGKTDREFLKNVGRLGTPNLVSDASTKGCAKAFLFRALHEHDEHHQEAHDDQDSLDNVNCYVHREGDFDTTFLKFKC